MTAKFADISHYQGSVDLVAYKAAGYDRIAMKVSEANFWDNTFFDRWRQAGQLGLARVGYHFLRNDIAGSIQFDTMINAIAQADPLAPGDRLCLDVEDPRPGMTARATAAAKQFFDAAVVRGYSSGWIYSGKWYLEPAGFSALSAPVGWRNLWISDYSSDVIQLPSGWSQEQLVACQYTDNAQVPGIGSSDADFVIKEWLDMTSPSNWSAADWKAFPEHWDAVMDKRYSGTPAMTPTEFLAGVRNWQKGVDAAVKAVQDDVAAANTELVNLSSVMGQILDRLSTSSNGTVDVASLALQLAEHLQLKAV